MAGLNRDMNFVEQRFLFVLDFPVLLVDIFLTDMRQHLETKAWLLSFSFFLQLLSHFHLLSELLFVFFLHECNHAGKSLLLVLHEMAEDDSVLLLDMVLHCDRFAVVVWHSGIQISKTNQLLEDSLANFLECLEEWSNNNIQLLFDEEDVFMIFWWFLHTLILLVMPFNVASPLVE